MTRSLVNYDFCFACKRCQDLPLGFRKTGFDPEIGARPPKLA